MSWTCGGEQVESAVRGWLSLGHTIGRHPKVKGQNLLEPDHFLSIGILEMEQKKAMWGFTQSRLCHLLFSGRMQQLQETNGKRQEWGQGRDAFSLP